MERPYDATMPLASTIEVFRTFLGLGCIGFGGPVAHVALFRETLVRRRAWLDEARFADLLSLSQALPGPASSQLGFGIGVHRAGIAGGVAAWLGFTLPSAALMTAAAMGWQALVVDAAQGWIRGLKAAAVGVVAHALWNMARAFAFDLPRRVLVAMAALLTMSWEGAAAQPAVIALGALAGGLLLSVPSEMSVPHQTTRVRRSTALVAIALTMIALLVSWPPWTPFARSGALTFGGGHVVLPLLESRLVHEGGMPMGTFLAGYGLAQAVPGPLFSFAAFAGAAQPGALPPLAAAVVATVAIFVPGLLMMLAGLPLLPALRRSMRAQAALSGVHAAVVGLLLAALLGPLQGAGLVSAPTWGIAVATTAMLATSRWPVPLLVALAAVAGALLAGSA